MAPVQKKKIRGVTLLELMVVLVIAGIAFSAAVPAFNGMITRNRIATQVNDMLTAINLARSEALRVGGTVSVLALGPDPVNDEFGAGYCVVVGTPPANPDDYCTGEDDPGGADPRPIRVFSALEGQSLLNSVDNIDAIQFNSLGGLANTSSATRRFDLCHPTQDGRRIVISLVGRSKSHGPDDPVEANQPEC